MAPLPIPIRTNNSKFNFLGQPTLLNCYVEAQGSDTKAQNAVLPCAGLTEFVEVASTHCRGTIYLPDLDKAYSVHQESVYKITFNGTSATATRIGVIPGSDLVQFSRNQADPPQISIHCNDLEFYIENDVVKHVIDADTILPNCVSQDHVGGYTVYGLDDRRFYISALNDAGDISGLDFATAEQTPGPLNKVFEDGDLFLFKTDSVEQWRNTGNADFPFEPMSPIIKKGLLSPHAVAKHDNTIVYPGADSIVYRIAGTGQATRISDHGVERKIKNDSDQEGIIGFSYATEGHSFYNLTGEDWSRTYDAASKVWHSRQSYGIDRWRARFPFQAWGKTLFGDELTGKIFELDDDSFEEDGDPLIWGFDTPTLTSPTGAGVVDWIRFDVAVGYGTLPTTSQGYDPVMMVSWSVDGGNTFRANRHLKLGKRGTFTTTVRTRRCGRFGDKGIVFRVRVSDPVIRALSGMEIGARPMVVAK